MLYDSLPVAQATVFVKLPRWLKGLTSYTSLYLRESLLSAFSPGREMKAIHRPQGNFIKFNLQWSSTQWSSTLGLIRITWGDLKSRSQPRPCKSCNHIDYKLLSLSTTSLKINKCIIPNSHDMKQLFLSFLLQRVRWGTTVLTLPVSLNQDLCTSKKNSYFESAVDKPDFEHIQNGCKRALIIMFRKNLFFLLWSK